jgi:two-component system sensor histidine kinase VicK
MTQLPDKPFSKYKKIATSQERFRALVIATSDVIYSLSADWRVMYELDGRGF